VTEVSEKDDAAARFYEDAQNLRPEGEPKRPRRALRLSSHVPIRFSAETISMIRGIAEEDGLTVSSWVRRLVEREVERRMAALNWTSAAVTVRPVFPEDVSPATSNYYATTAA
jgi:hypothetical protein